MHCKDEYPMWISNTIKSSKRRSFKVLATKNQPKTKKNVTLVDHAEVEVKKQPRDAIKEKKGRAKADNKHKLAPTNTGLDTGRSKLFMTPRRPEREPNRIRGITYQKILAKQAEYDETYEKTYGYLIGCLGTEPIKRTLNHSLL